MRTASPGSIAITPPAKASTALPAAISIKPRSSTPKVRMPAPMGSAHPPSENESEASQPTAVAPRTIAATIPA